MWDKHTDNELHAIKQQLDNWPSLSKSRHTEVILTRLRTGHTHSTHSFLLSTGDPPYCERCGEPLTVLHILVQCNELDALRKNHFLLPYRQQLSLHPGMLIGRDPLFKLQTLFTFLKDVQSFHPIFRGHP
uniref:Putative tick transposon n=1 Tax=Rhipicephalus microplus TaxID=6941 RepID=A0A6G5AEQ2_RHIMP